MKHTISLKEAIKLLDDCSGVVVDDNTITYAGMTDQQCDEEPFMTLTYEDNVEENFYPPLNREVQIAGSSMWLVGDDPAEPVQITLLQPWNIEEHLNHEVHQGRDQ